eukprot:m.116438 g.116438  ORF g.116438 m.116438 type:complete len:389 (+) comp13135_c0_seq2:195-1361(+)
MTSTGSLPKSLPTSAPPDDKPQRPARIVSRSATHSRSASWDGTRAALLALKPSTPLKFPVSIESPPAPPPSPMVEHVKRRLHELFWLGLGFRTTPDWDVVQLLVVYTVSASVMLAVNKHLARTDRFDAIALVQLQLGTSLVFLGVGKLAGKINLTLSVTEGGPHEIYAWLTLSVLFAIQLVASIRTLQTHHVTEWYMILHYFTPVAVPFLERHLPIIDEADVRPPLSVIVFPLLSLMFAVVWSYSTTGVFGPGTTNGAFWSFIWVSARVSTMVGSRAAILRYKTPIWNRLLFQTLGAFTVFATIVSIYPAAVDTTWERTEAEPLSMPLVLQYLLLGLSCGVQLLVAWARLSILGRTTASTFAILSSVGVMPARLYYSGYRLFDANPHN